MPKNLKFTIITPSYNQASTLTQTIQSVIGYSNLQYLLFDNCSTDGSDKIIKNFAAKISKIKFQIKKDAGQADAINHGLQKAAGDIIAYLNSDDYYLPGTLQKVSDYFVSHPGCLWLVGDCQVSDSKLSWTFWLKHLWPIDKYSWALPIFNTINQPAVFLRRELIQKVGFFDTGLHYAFDYDYWLRCQKISLPYRLHQPLAVFRIHPGSKGNLNFRRQFQEDYQVVVKHTSHRLILLLHCLGDWLVNLSYQILK